MSLYDLRNNIGLDSLFWSKQHSTIMEVIYKDVFMQKVSQYCHI